MPAQKMEAYAARAIEIASQSTDPIIQEILIEMAQRWMAMAMDEEDGEGHTVGAHNECISLTTSAAVVGKKFVR
jgi:hypothetical protein